MKTLAEVASKLRRGPQSIAYIGNSVTAQRDGYRPLLHKLIEDWSSHRHDTINFGLGGVGSFGSAALFDLFVAKRRPSVAFIETSLADSGLNTPVEWVEDSVRSLVKSLQEMETTAVFLHMPRIDEFRSHVIRTRALYDEIAATAVLPQIDVEQSLTKRGLVLRQAMFTDGIHTTAEGGRMFATAIAEDLKDAEESLTTVGPTTLSRDSSDGWKRLRTHWIDSVPFTAGASSRGFYRLQLPTIRLTPGSQTELTTVGSSVVGLVVVVDSESGVMEVAAGSDGLTVQLADEWTNRSPRLQVVPFPRNFRVKDTLRVTCSVRDTAARDAAGRFSQVQGTAKSLQLCGLVFEEPAP